MAPLLASGGAASAVQVAEAEAAAAAAAAMLTWVWPWVMSRERGWGKRRNFLALPINTAFSHTNHLVAINAGPDLGGARCQLQYTTVLIGNGNPPLLPNNTAFFAANRLVANNTGPD